MPGNSRKKVSRLRLHSLWVLTLFLYIVFAIFLFIYSHPAKVFSETQQIYDLIWLDAWIIAFFLAMVIFWNSRLSSNSKFILSIGCLSIFGVIVVALIFDGSPFGMNAYWGDQKFRIAMILKFINFGWFTDFYYKGLPSFYPPVYFFLLSLYAKIFSLDAYKMIKIGSMLTFLFGPILLYFFWKKIVSSYRAFFITVGGFLFCTTSIHFQLFSPHAYIANLFFIPWFIFWCFAGSVTRYAKPPAKCRMNWLK